MKIHALAAFLGTHDHLAHVVQLPWSRASRTPANDEQAQVAGMMADRRAVSPGTRCCNRHLDCDEADADTMLGHGRTADHCHEQYCEDCLGY